MIRYQNRLSTLGIAVGTLASPITCMIAITLSLLVSYVRARSESLGVPLQGIGIGERAERLLLLALIGMLPLEGSSQWAVIIVINSSRLYIGSESIGGKQTTINDGLKISP